MKKFLLLVVVLFIGTSVFAQDSQFGIKGGLNFANFKGDDVEDTDMKTDIFIGAFARFAIDEKLAFQPELVYSRQGFKIDGDGGDATWKSNYMNIPLLLRAGLADKFHALVGPQIGFHLSSEAEISSGGSSLSEDADDQMKGVDLSFALGLEYDITDKVALGLRYNLGLSNIIDEDDAKVQNSVFQLGVSLAF
ncbi:porin family protein [Marinifilum caeruleilacunae]|uniref:PorT family protein n=1 Tax=Marinifilum caeruleilacunae TaxID=2499076 RepID=A0ABX1WQT3_9BACT|nr:porin family protein [Marinifilum caeruleilacunae]NOU58454.1 PorT family protein [Marinifilum caeruleilacunae]